MEIRVAAEQPWDVDADVLAFPVPQDGAGEAVLSELDRRLDGALGDYRRVGELTGKAHGTALLRGRETAAPWLLGVGIGESSSFDALAALRFGAAVERRLGGLVCERLAIWLPAELLNGARAGAANGGGADDLAELIARGAVEGQHEPGSIYRDSVEGAPPQLRELIVVAPDGATDGLRAAVQRGVIIGEGGNRARRLAQRASNDVSPEVLADEATAVAREFGLQVEVIGPERATEMGMNLFMAVGRGSSNAPRFIVLRSGEQAAKDGEGRLLAMVGKGVTFDSGGISIKPADRMEEMKMDKTGACTVISAIATVATLAPGTPLMAVAPAVENLPGPHSTRPGDIVRALNGKVVEIQNTDAEGRLILADALTYAEQQGATHLVDVATLTGAVERAFGKQITGGFGTPQDWWDEVFQAGARQAERYWQVPLVEEYNADLDSWYADFVNTGGAEGSLVKSGLFLQQFVTKPWAHLDIGGTAYLRKPTPWAARGATGVTHATLVELALNGASSAA